jgi:hypothetical protein
MGIRTAGPEVSDSTSDAVASGDQWLEQVFAHVDSQRPFRALSAT